MIEQRRAEENKRASMNHSFWFHTCCKHARHCWGQPARLRLLCQMSWSCPWRGIWSSDDASMEEEEEEVCLLPV